MPPSSLTDENKIGPGNMCPDQDYNDEFEVVDGQMESNPLRTVIMDPRVQNGFKMLKERVLSPFNEVLTNRGNMRKFLAPEALNLRHCLEILCLYHTFNVVFMNISIFMKLVDLLFMFLTLYSSLHLSKLYIIGYALSCIIIIFIGLSHLPYLNNFRGLFAYFYFCVELLVLTVGTVTTLVLLQAHVLIQEVIRQSNIDKKNRYNLNKQIAKQFEPGVIR